MFRQRRPLVKFVLLSLFLLFSSFPGLPAAFAEDCQTFYETGFQVCGNFLNYWQTHGGIAQQGLPISGVFEEQTQPPFGDGKSHNVQYFQRARFEEHTENQAPNNILLGLLGKEQIKTKYENSPKGLEPQGPNCRSFQETGFKICGTFLTYWDNNGGLAQQGFPLSNVFEEVNSPPPAGDGQMHRVQYFERARFEEHTQGSGGLIQLGLLGSEQIRTRYKTLPTPATSQAPTSQGSIDLLTETFFTSVQGTSPGGMASVTIKTKPFAACSISHATTMDIYSKAEGLVDKRADGNGVTSWSWTISVTDYPGKTIVKVTCNGISASAILMIDAGQAPETPTPEQPASKPVPSSGTGGACSFRNSVVSISCSYFTSYNVAGYTPLDGLKFLVFTISETNISNRDITSGVINFEILTGLNYVWHDEPNTTYDLPDHFPQDVFLQAGQTVTGKVVFYIAARDNFASIRDRYNR